MLTEQENIRQIKEKVYQLLAQTNKSEYVIIDGDKTLIPTDSTKFFFTHLGLNFSDLENIFHKSGYSFESFHNAALFYSKIPTHSYYEACVASSVSVSVYPEFISFLNSISDKVEILVITSGITRNWKNILQNHSLDFIHLIGGNYFPDDTFIVDKNAKGIIASELITAGKTVHAFGDTMIDFEMLRNATHSFLVVNENLNDDFTENFSEIPHLKQITFSNFSHSNLPLTNLQNIAEKILSK